MKLDASRYSSKTRDEQLKELANVDANVFFDVVTMYYDKLQERFNELEKNNISTVSVEEFFETTDILKMFFEAEVQREVNFLGNSSGKQKIQL